MATMRLHPFFYTPTVSLIGRTTSERPRLVSSYSLFAPSVKVTTPLYSDASLTIFRANLFASCCCPSRKLRNTIGRDCLVSLKRRLWLAPLYNPPQNAKAPKSASSLSYYITSTCAKRPRGLVKTAVTRASRVYTKKPIGSSAGSRASPQEPLPTSSLLTRISAFLSLRRGAQAPSLSTITQSIIIELFTVSKKKQ